ncbi:SIR2 family protein [Brevundimonas vesicularis]|uniref:P-loop NTPase n=1 Tax=Brevundimonas vesicularis TaxID=41276 RepID=UPI0022ABCBC1|nr:SIR2 family protein [Brevundimonas vesicularis]
MLDIAEEDARFLLQTIKEGDATLVLGAGASFGSENARRQPVKMASELAAEIARAAALPYADESLTDVIGAAKQFLSDVQLTEIYKNEYRGVRPSEWLEQLFGYTWKRAYTWNIDDSVQNINRRSAQARRYFNGIIDAVHEIDGKEFLQFISLHGEISRPELGLIMSESQYSDTLSRGGHKWYRQAAQDYLAFSPIFIGSKLSEPILKSELQRAMRDASSAQGRAYLVVPENLTPIQKGNYRSQGIIHIKATLEEFVRWLKSELPNGVSTASALSAHNIRIPADDISRLTPDERQAAWNLKPIKVSNLEASIASATSQSKAAAGRKFYRGFAPSWDVAASDIPVWLRATDDLDADLKGSIQRRDRLFVVLGQAGSGKTTALMQSLVKRMREDKSIIVYELKGEGHQVRSAFSLIDKIHSTHVVVFVPDLFLLGDAFRGDVESLSGRNITVVSTARSSEWRERLERHFGDYASTSTFQRFIQRDYAPLIDRLLSYVPAPKFLKMSGPDRERALGRSKSQLLIALREATESKTFDDIITSEFESLPDDDTKDLLLIVSLATIARVGIRPEVAKSVYEANLPKRSFQSALAALDGIVSLDSYGRLLARHELYVRHVLTQLVQWQDFSRAVVGVLRTYTQYAVPIIKNVNKKDGQLFRFIINHDFIMQRAKKDRSVSAGIGIYEEFEVEFQLDGHYWLQYGLYLSEAGDDEGSMTMLRRSIEAYPDNVFAVHAYAD